MTKWEYIWRPTYWTEASRQGDYVQWVSYKHVWKPDLNGPEEPFPSQGGIDGLGAKGWELVTVLDAFVSLATRISPQNGDAYSQFSAPTLIFKRPVEA